MLHAITFLVCTLSVTSVINGCAEVKNSSKLLLVSFDGFRWDYLQRRNTKLNNFGKLISDGVKAKWIEDVFVTQTFPNHYTIVTGLYEESHGIVANRFYDPVLNKTFAYSATEDEFWGGEPIWITNQLHSHHSGVYFWVGSEAKVKNMRPTIYKTYNSSMPWIERVDTVVNWLTNGFNDQDINLALLYFNQPDHDGHKYGPESDEVTETIQRCDNITGYLISRLEETGIFNDLNIIITSDHGMTELSEERTVDITNYVDPRYILKVINYGVGTAIWPNDDHDLERIYNNLKKIGPHIKVYRKEDIPTVYHYTNNVRIPPILLVPDDGWWINYDSSLPMMGSHGYNNRLLDMHPFFIAHGPAFKQNFLSEPFSSVNIYSLMCHLLGFPPAPNNGSLENISHILRNDITNVCLQPYNTELYIILICVISAFVLLLVFLIIIKRRESKRRDKELSDILDDRVFSTADDGLYLSSNVELHPLVNYAPLSSNY